MELVQLDRRIQGLQEDMANLRMAAYEVPELREEVARLRANLGDSQAMRDELALVRADAAHSQEQFTVKVHAIMDQAMSEHMHEEVCVAQGG